MKNHEAEQLNDELLTETRHHSDTLRKWQKDIELNQQLRNEIDTLKAQNERLVKALEWFLKAHIDGVVLCSTIENAKLYNEKEKEAKAALEEVKKC